MDKYKVEVIQCKGLRVKGDDTSTQIALMLSENCNQNSKLNWNVHSVIPSLTSEGAILKLIVLYERMRK